MNYNYLRNLVIGTLFSVNSFAQSEHQSLMDANKKYDEGKYLDAARIYEQILKNSQTSLKANYNNGNTWYRQDSFDKATNYYKQAAEQATDQTTKAQAFHNLGNGFLQKKDYGQAIDAYKNALRLKPDDFDTKNNLAYAMRIQQQQQQQQQQQNQDKEENKDKQEPKPEPKEEKPKDENERLMDIIEEEDKKTQKKAQDGKPRPKKNEKDW